MKPHNLDLGIDARKAHALLDRREAERVSIECQVTYTPEDGLGGGSQVGTLRDLAKTGCQILSVQPPATGSRITLTLHLPDGQTPMCLVGTTVCQVKGNVFGVQFPPLTSDERRRLQTVIFQRATRGESSGKRAAFRIV